MSERLTEYDAQTAESHLKTASDTLRAANRQATATQSIILLGLIGQVEQARQGCGQFLAAMAADRAEVEKAETKKGAVR
jgi:hypothetical protein